MKKQQKITVKAFVHVGDELVDVDTLPPEKKVELATRLKVDYLNGMFAGKAVFRPAQQGEASL